MRVNCARGMRWVADMSFFVQGLMELHILSYTGPRGEFHGKHTNLERPDLVS